MKRYKTLFTRILILLFLLNNGGCYNDPMEDLDVKRSASRQLTVEEAYHLFKTYASSLSPATRSSETSCMLLDPGMITPDWSKATQSNNTVNSYVSVPIQTTNAFLAKSSTAAKATGVSQKLVIVQEDSSRRNSVYLLSLLPEGEYAAKHRYDLSEDVRGGKMPDGYTGLIVYTRLDGGLPLYAASYEDGEMVKDVFLLDKAYTIEENTDKLNQLLAGKSLQGYQRASLSMYSEGWGGGGGGGHSGGGGGGSSSGGGSSTSPGQDDWQFKVDGPPFSYGDYNTCWRYTGPDGKSYIVADTNGDGKPDTVLLDDADAGGEVPVNPGGGGTIGGDIGSGGELPSGGGSETKVGPLGTLSKAIFSAQSRLTREEWEKMEKVLENINIDCMGGRLVRSVKNKNILLVHDPELENKFGAYNPQQNKLTIRDFEEKDLNESIERTILHELIHCVQGPTTTSQLNYEVEVHVGIYVYAKRTKRIPVGGEKYQNMFSLTLTIDNKFNIIDQTRFEECYMIVVEYLKNNNYEKFKENKNARNFNTMKELSKDC